MHPRVDVLRTQHAGQGCWPRATSVRDPPLCEPAGGQRHGVGWETRASVHYRILGGTGIEVSQLCLGSMMFGAWGNTDEAECHRMVATALDAGVNFVDTADVYAFGESEEIVGRALKGRRDEVVLVSKVASRMPAGPLDRNRGGASRLWI